MREVHKIWYKWVKNKSAIVGVFDMCISTISEVNVTNFNELHMIWIKNSTVVITKLESIGFSTQIYPLVQTIVAENALKFKNGLNSEQWKSQTWNLLNCRHRYLFYSISKNMAILYDAKNCQI